VCSLAEVFHIVHSSIMGLLDWFRRPPPKPLLTPHELLDLYAQVGALSADLETTKSRLEGLKTEWLTMREELRKLAQRLEKRDQRAAEREQQPEENTGFDEVEALRALRMKRGRNGVL